MQTLAPDGGHVPLRRQALIYWPGETTRHLDAGRPWRFTLTQARPRTLAAPVVIVAATLGHRGATLEEITRRLAGRVIDQFCGGERPFAWLEYHPERRTIDQPAAPTFRRLLPQPGIGLDASVADWVSREWVTTLLGEPFLDADAGQRRERNIAAQGTLSGPPAIPDALWQAADGHTPRGRAGQLTIDPFWIPRWRREWVLNRWRASAVAFAPHHRHYATRFGSPILHGTYEQAIREVLRRLQPCPSLTNLQAFYCAHRHPLRVGWLDDPAPTIGALRAAGVASGRPGALSVEQLIFAATADLPRDLVDRLNAERIIEVACWRRLTELREAYFTGASRRGMLIGDDAAGDEQGEQMPRRE